tara:strand:- start:1352 stop:3019 length:1668 start_codon:yes stop_codon:yes gene_type:complete
VFTRTATYTDGEHGNARPSVSGSPLTLPAPPPAQFSVPGKYSGGAGSGFTWTQTQSEVELRAQLPEGADPKRVKCSFTVRRLELSWEDCGAPIEGELSALLALDDCLWSVEEEAGAKTVVATLRKQVPGVWEKLFASDAAPAEPPKLLDGPERSVPKSKKELLADAKARAKGAIDEPSKAKMHAVEGKSGEVVTLDPASMPGLPVIFVKRCEDCEILLPENATAIKVQMQDCKRCVLTIRGKVITETLELWECEACRVTVGSRLATIQVDACHDLALAFAKAEYFDRVMSAGLHAGKLSFDDAPQLGTPKIDFASLCAERGDETISDRTDQFITRLVGDAVLTELIIRLCNDFPTTEREAKEFELRTRMQHDKLDEVVDGMLGSSIGKNMTAAEKEQMKGMFAKQSDAASAAKIEAEQTAEGRQAARIKFKKDGGNDEFKQGNFQQAAVLYTEALALDDAQHALYSNRAACFLKLGRYAQAREDAQKCIELAPDFAKGHFRLALALQAEEKYGEACASFDKVLKLDSSNKDAKSGLQVAQMQAERQRRQQAGQTE